MAMPTSMNSRDRVLAALRRDEVDRTPICNPTSVATVELMDLVDAPFPQANREPELMARLAATSYTELRTEEPGEHVVRVCTGLGCRINGGDELSAAVIKELDVQAGETTPDGRITFEEADCGFLCAMAPAVELDGKWVGRATPEMVKQLIRHDGT